MQDNPSTSDNEDLPLPLNAEDWKVAFEPYEGQPEAALSLAFRLAELKQLIEGLRKHQALLAIGRAIDGLYEHSDFRSVGRDLFLEAIEGELTIDKEEVLRHLGIRI